MKQNITLCLDKELIAKAKIIAARRRVSINKMLADELKNLVDQSERYEIAKKRALLNLEQGFHFGGTGMISREALHDR